MKVAKAWERAGVEALKRLMDTPLSKFLFVPPIPLCLMLINALTDQRGNERTQRLIRGKELTLKAQGQELTLFIGH